MGHEWTVGGATVLTAASLGYSVLADRFFLQPAGAVNLISLSAGCWRVDGFILLFCLESISYGPALF
jgi:hypothetical protein